MVLKRVQRTTVSEYKSKRGRRLLRTTTWPTADPQGNRFQAIADLQGKQDQSLKKLLVLIVRDT